MEKISIIVPCYNEEKAIPLFYDEMERVIKEDFAKINVKFEYIFVNDGSTDNTLHEIKELHKKDKKIRYISFSRNFGKEAAMFAGLEAAEGDYITLMDADLQDPPSLLIRMYDTIKEEGYDCVATRRVTRKGEPPIRSFFSRLFYKLINKITDFEMVNGARDYRLMTKQVKDAIITMKEYNRFSKGLASFVGYDTKWIEYENVKRNAGETKWSFWKLFKYALEGVTAFSTAPLAISSILGLLFTIISVIFIFIIIIKTLVFGDPTSGWPSMVCIMLFMGGIQLLSLGVIGQYLAKTYLEVKNRPIYFVKETDNDETKD
jgi:glycosyltransferase involved in cell wall biosynthesis